MKTQSPPFQVLKGLHLDELAFIADKLSGNREKWHYDKRSRSSVKKALVSNVSEGSLAKVLKESLGERMPSGDLFPKSVQFGRVVLGPLDFLKSVVERRRRDADVVANIFTKYVRGEKLTEKLVRECCDKMPEVTAKSVIKGTAPDKSLLVQLALTFLSDKEISGLVNTLLEKEELEIDATDSDEDLDYPWIITRYGIVVIPKDEPVENLASVIKDHYSEKDLEPELKRYSGDFQTKLLEYCIMENPEIILQQLFGLPTLRKIARTLGFASDKIGSTAEVVALILLGLGFSVPPSVTGTTTYLSNIQKHNKNLSESREISEKSGIMSQVFVTMEKALRDVAFFHLAFIWKERLDEIESIIEDEMPELTSKQVRIKTLDFFIRNKFKVRKRFERMGFGDFINLIRTMNKTIHEHASLEKRMIKAFGREWVLNDKSIRRLDRISPYRSNFAHAKDYPGDEKCGEIVKSVEDFLMDIQLQGSTLSL